VALVPAKPGGGVVGYGRFQQDGDSVLYPAVARVPGSPGGLYVAWRRLASSSATRTQLASILGNDAAVYLLNADGSLWSELGRPAERGPGKLDLGHVALFHRAGRGDVLSVSDLIEGTPWAFAFEFPSAVVLAPAVKLSVRSRSSPRSASSAARSSPG
jgi:hypothetical protein